MRSVGESMIKNGRDNLESTLDVLDGRQQQKTCEDLSSLPAINNDKSHGLQPGYWG